MNLWKLAFEYFGVITVVAILSFLPLTKIAIGAVLSVVGAFLPSSTAPSDGRRTANRAAFKLFGVNITLAGSIRFSVICAGILILIISAVEIGSTALKTRRDVSSEQLSNESLTFGNLMFVSAVENSSLRELFLKKTNIESNKKLYTAIWITHCALLRQDVPAKNKAVVDQICRVLLLNISPADFNDVLQQMHNTSGVEDRPASGTAISP